MQPASLGYSVALDEFGELSVGDLYGCLRLRAAVFVVEQSCAYQDLDGLDAGSLHLRVFDAAGSLAAYARLLPPGLDFPLACSVGRIVTGPDHRGQGYGKVLVGEALTRCTLLWPEVDVVIRAQTYLLNFYHEFGFAAEGEPFLEDGIPHQQMRRSATRAS